MSSNPVRRIEPTPIGGPMSFVSGQFSGQTLRGELVELQKADLGRKYARKDRRPLDPPPVVQFRLFEVIDAGTPRQTEREFDNYDDMKSFGVLCHVDLFPVPGEDEADNKPTGTNGVRHNAQCGLYDDNSAASPMSSTPIDEEPRTYNPAYRSSPSPPYAVPSLLPSSLSNYTGSIPAPLSPPIGFPSSGLYQPSMLPMSTMSHSFALPAPAPMSTMGHNHSIPPSATSSAFSYSIPAPAPPPWMSYSLPVSGPSSTASYSYSISAPSSTSGMPYPYSIPAPAPTSSMSHMYTLPAPAPLSSPSLQGPGMLSSGSYSLSGYPSSPGLRTQFPAPYSPARNGRDPDIIAYMGDHPIRESSKCTEALAGATFVQSAGLEYKGKKALMFVFSDLAVKAEGTFLLRYRVFNIFSKASGDHEIPVLAECFGGPFRIYSTKEFPGLRASTDLTKHISFYGVRLNLRENERKRRKKSEIEADNQKEAHSFASSEPSSSSAVEESPTMSVSSVSTVDGSSNPSSRGKRSQRDRDRTSEDESNGHDMCNRDDD